MGMKDYYDILEINETASTEVIKAAYRALVKKYHPDNYELENEDITERMAELNEAYAVLSDEKKRKDYDIQYTSINSQKKERNHKPESTPCTSEEQSNHKTKKDGFFTSFIKTVGEEMLNTLAENQNAFNSAYAKGCTMEDTHLIRIYKSSTGIRRNGYGKVLEERGILRRDKDGRLIPTYSYRNYFF